MIATVEIGKDKKMNKYLTKLFKHTCFDVRESYITEYGEIAKDHIKRQSESSYQNHQYNQKLHKFLANNPKHRNINAYDRHELNIME
jgi:hypothetical protein